MEDDEDGDNDDELHGKAMDGEEVLPFDIHDFRGCRLKSVGSLALVGSKAVAKP